MIKNKKIFIILIVLYIIGYSYFCIYGGINVGTLVKDKFLLRELCIFSNMPVGVLNLSTYVFSWIFISFFLVLFIVWQTNVEGPKLNRTALLCEGANILLTCLSRAIVEAIVSGIKEGLFTALLIIIVLLVIVGSALLIAYIVQRKNGASDSYESYFDIMTEEEFERWQERKRKKGKL